MGRDPPNKQISLTISEKDDRIETQNYLILLAYFILISLQRKSIQPCIAICFSIDKCLRLQIIKSRMAPYLFKMYKNNMKNSRGT